MAGADADGAEVAAPIPVDRRGQDPVRCNRRGHLARTQRQHGGAADVRPGPARRRTGSGSIRDGRRTPRHHREPGGRAGTDACLAAGAPAATSPAERLIVAKANGQAFAPGFVRQSMRRANKECSIKGITPPRLRGTFAPAVGGRRTDLDHPARHATQEPCDDDSYLEKTSAPRRACRTISLQKWESVARDGEHRL